MDDVVKLLEKANDRLKAGRIGVVLEARGKGLWLQLRGTFPPKPGSDRAHPFQQRIALKMRATPQAIQQAEAIAKLVGAELNMGVFNWRKWSDADEEEEDTQLTLKSLWSNVEKIWWRDRLDTPSAQNSWRTLSGCCGTFDWDAVLTIEAIEDWITTHTKPNQQRRNHYLQMSKLIAKAAGLNPASLSELQRPNGYKVINPRDLPSEEEIVAVRDRIKNPAWQYIYGLIATYGLRSHEVWSIDLSEFPLVRVGEDTKTGERIVAPLYPEWAEKWSLQNWISPRIRIAQPCRDAAGRRTTGGFKKQKIPFSPYNLRHSYARRCAAFGIQPYEAARLMGHSSKIHEFVYRAWIGEKVVLDRVAKLVAREDRPLPP